MCIIVYIAFLIKEVPLFKRYVMAAPFVHAFDKVLKGEKFDTIRIPYRDEESIYIICYEGKSCVVLYSVKFRDADDIVLAKTFLQEFKDARRDKAMGNAPSVNFSQGQKPLELKGIQSGEPDDPESLKAYGFVSLGMQQVTFYNLQACSIVTWKKSLEMVQLTSCCHLEATCIII